MKTSGYEEELKRVRAEIVEAFMLGKSYTYCLEPNMKFPGEMCITLTRAASPALLHEANSGVLSDWRTSKWVPLDSAFTVIEDDLRTRHRA